jgi:hypothetical protein
LSYWWKRFEIEAQANKEYRVCPEHPASKLLLMSDHEDAKILVEYALLSGKTKIAELVDTKEFPVRSLAAKGQRFIAAKSVLKAVVAPPEVCSGAIPPAIAIKSVESLPLELLH